MSVEQNNPVAQTAPRRGRVDLAIVLLLVALVIGVYARVAGHAFITFDDMTYIVDNPHVNTGLSWTNARWALTAGHASNWHPLTWWSHQLDVSLFGLDAGRHHLVNVALHAVNVLLWFLVLSTMTGSRWRSAVVAALVAVHPIHVESVAWAAERKDVLAALFGLLALWAYVAYVRRGGALRYLLVALGMALSLMAKPMLVTLPALLLLVDVWPLRRGASWPRLVAEKLPLLALSVASAIITMNVQRGEAIIRADALPLADRLMSATVAYGRYLEHLVWPVGLAHYYPHPHTRLGGAGIEWWRIVVSAMVLIGITMLAAAVFRRARFVMVGWLWFLGTMVPVIGIVQVGLQGMADRYAYWPFVGLYIALVWAAAALAQRWRFGVAVAPAGIGVCIAALVAMAYVQAGHWKDSFTLYAHTLSVTDDNYFVHTGVGLAHARHDAFERAIPAFEQALAIRPDFVLARTSLGKALWLTGNEDGAVAHFRRAVELDPTNPVALYHLGVAEAARRRYEQAAALFEAALKRAPHDPVVWHQLGVARKYLRQPEAALDAQRRAVELAPRYAEALTELGLLLAQRGDLEQAERYLRRVVQQAPDDLLTRQNLALVLLRLGRAAEAVEQDEAVLAAAPQTLGSLDRLSQIYASHPDPALRNPSRALALARRACELTDHASPPLLAALAGAQAATGDPASAAATLHRAAALCEQAGQMQQAQVYRQAAAAYEQRGEP